MLVVNCSWLHVPGLGGARVSKPTSRGGRVEPKVALSFGSLVGLFSQLCRSRADCPTCGDVVEFRFNV